MAESAGKGRRRRGKAAAPAASGRRCRLGRLLLRAAKYCLVAGIWLGVAAGCLVAWYAWDLPDISLLETPTRQPAVVLRGADGTILARHGQLHSGPVRFADLPYHLVRAIQATEDRGFFDHPGISALGLLRATIVNLRAGAVRQGGSTITQQLAKNLFLGPERTVRRKVQEAILALWLEKRFTKRQIFSIYVNRVYFGSGAYGIEAAAQRYFGRPAKALTLRQSALLAGLLKAPSRYSPVRSARAAVSRSDRVLAAMVDAGYLHADEAAAAGRTPLGLRAEGGAGTQYFADWALARATGHVGDIARDLTVTTTLNPGLQRLAESRALAILDAEEKRSGASQVAVVIMSIDGGVRAMVGGRAYGASQFNRAAQAQRQPGSAFKLFVYLAGLEAGLGPDDVFVDKPVRVDGWSPRNYDGLFHGPMRLADAFARSVNSIAVQVSERIGRGRVRETARRLGITTPLAAHPSIALGASEVTLVELTAAYAAIASGGVAIWPFAVAAVHDRAGREVYRRAGSGRRRVVAPAHAEAMRAMLRAAIGRGTGRGAALGIGEAGKTGTSQGFRDAWFVGFAGGLVAGVWVGNDDGRPMRGVTGGGLPARIWRSIMAAALVDRRAGATG